MHLLRSRPSVALAALLSGVLGLGALAAPATAANAPQDDVWTVTGPSPPGSADGPSAVVALDPTDGSLSVSVRNAGHTVLEPAPAGIVTDRADLTSGLRLLERTDRTVSEHYTTTVGKERERSASMTESRFALAGAGGARVDLVVRASDDGVAYRYVLPDPDGVTVRHEASSFRLPGDATAWLSPYVPNYERTHTENTAAAAPTGDYAYPSLFRSAGSYVLLTESDVDGRYSGSRLTHQAGSGRYDVELADPEIPSAGPLATPWRTAIVGDLPTVTTSTLVDDLAPPSRIHDTSWIRPGRVAWSWLAGFGQAQRSLATQKRFVDYAAAHGWEYSLVDDGWKTTDWMPELIDYATARGVKILVWMRWTDLDTPAERTAQLDKVKKWGAAGLKIDFMDSDSRARFAWYDDILKETAERKLLVNFHGSTIPRGTQRTWPHVMAMEAVHGAEQGDVKATDISTLPYTRNVAGSMDFTPMAFQFGQHNVSEAAELALSVVYESGFQNYAGAIEEYHKRPQLERFLEQVPTVWDETRLLAGSPGDGATFARRSGSRWFLGSVTAGDARTQRISLGFLPGDGKWLVETVRDGDHGLVRDSAVMDDRDTLEVPTGADGGFAAIVCRSTPGRTTCDRPVDRVPPATLDVTPDRTVTERGDTADVAGRFTIDEFGPVSDVSLTAQAPEGWTVEGGGARADQLSTGQPLEATWKVTVPADAPFGYTSVPVRAEFRNPSDRGARTLTVERTVRVFVHPPGVRYVSDLPFASATNGWGPVERDTSNGENAGGDGGPLRLGGTVYDKGLGVHARSEVTLDLAGGYDRFTARAGVDDEVSGKGSVAFELLGDGRVLARSGVVRSGDAAIPFDVDVRGVRTLTLRVTDGGDGVDSDHADWADAQLHLSG